MTMLWTPPAPSSRYRAARRPLWSMRQIALAIIAAVAMGAITVVGVSHADTGSSSSTTDPGGGVGVPGGGFGRGGFGPGGFGAGGLGGGGFGSGLPGQLGGGTGQFGGAGQAGVPQPDPAVGT